ncbi:MAG: DUF1173 domain-containing protein [Methylococcaceae bacterium]|nr:DUF1173 domain-containing protein [Methylococcaceae bacterium]
MKPNYLIEGQKFSADDGELQPALASAYGRHSKPLCLCKIPALEMYIAKVNGVYIIKRMPNTGCQHDPDCGSYEIPAELSGLGQFLGSAIKKNIADGLTTLKFDFALSKGVSRTTPAGTTQEKYSVRTVTKKLSLRATLQYIWEQAGFNKWSPAMAGKRNWHVIRKYLYEAAKDNTTKNVALDKLIYIPEAFDLDHKQDIAERRIATLSHLHEDNKPQQFMLIIGEVKEINSARFGYKMVIKHLPDFNIMLNNDIYRHLCKRFDVELELWSANESGHLIVMGTFGINASGIPSFEEITLMMVTENWIPYDNADELRLITELTQANQRFIKCLSYNLPSSIPTASVLLTDKVKTATALFIFPSSAIESY